MIKSVNDKWTVAGALCFYDAIFGQNQIQCLFTALQKLIVSAINLNFYITCRGDVGQG
jgi:hypothetical protein